MPKLLSFATLLLVTVLPLPAFADDTICADTFITGTHDNVIVPPGTICDSSAQIMGNVKVFGGYNAHPGTTVEGNIDGEPDHMYVRLLGADVVVRGNVQLKKAGQSESSGYLAGTVIGGDFHWEDNANYLFALGGTIGGNLVVVKSSGGGEIFGNFIEGNLHCSENDPQPSSGDNNVGGNKEGQCSDS